MTQVGKKPTDRSTYSYMLFMVLFVFNCLYSIDAKPKIINSLGLHVVFLTIIRSGLLKDIQSSVKKASSMAKIWQRKI